MGKLRYDPKQSKTQKVINKTLKKPIKITYISSPLLVRACDASDFRSIVQQLTGKDSNDLSNESILHNKDHTLYNQEPPTWVMQGEGGDDLCATTTTATEEDYGNGSSYYYNRSMDSLEFNQDYFWKEVAMSVLESPSCVLV